MPSTSLQNLPAFSARSTGRSIGHRSDTAPQPTPDFAFDQILSQAASRPVQPKSPAPKEAVSRAEPAVRGEPSQPAQRSNETPADPSPDGSPDASAKPANTPPVETSDESPVESTESSDKSEPVPDLPNPVATPPNLPVVAAPLVETPDAPPANPESPVAAVVTIVAEATEPAPEQGESTTAKPSVAVGQAIPAARPNQASAGATSDVAAGADALGDRPLASIDGAAQAASEPAGEAGGQSDRPSAPPDAVDPAVAPATVKPAPSHLAPPTATDSPVIAAAPGGAPTVDPSPAPLTPVSNAGPTRFAEVNHPPIVSTVRGQLLPSGGTMQIRLDPPELGALLIQVTVRDGLMAASFQTSNPEAAQLLSHSLTQLKHSLESQGVSVDRLQVAQAPRGERSDNSTDRNAQQHNGQPNSSAFDASRQNDQQRREMLRRIWAKLGVGDPLDLVA